MSAETVAIKGELIRLSVIMGGLACKLIVDPKKITEDSGVPRHVIDKFSNGIPINLDPSYPLDLNLDDPDELIVNLSFESARICAIPWNAIAIAIVQYPDEPVVELNVNLTKSASHLRVLN